MIDIDSDIPANVEKDLRNIEGVLRVRVLN